MTEEATIRRGARNARYTTLPNQVLEDVRLSMEARWLLGYLLSKPDNWIVRVADISKKGGCGRDKARRMVNELVENGYAEKEQARGDEGKFGRLSLVVYDEPADRRESENTAEEASVASLPQTENPSTAEPSTANASLVNTEDLAIPDSQPREARAGERGARSDQEIQAARPSRSAPPQVQPAAAGVADREARRTEAQFWRIVKNWPGFDGMPKEPAKPHFLALDQATRDAAERRLPGWLALLKAQGKDHVPAPSTYFRERLFDVVPDPLEAPKPPVEARPFGKLWGAVRMRALLAPPAPPPPPPRAQADLLAEDSERGARARLERQARFGWPLVNAMQERADQLRGTTVPAAEEWLGELMAQTRAGTPEREAWREEHARRGWPWPSAFDRVEWIWFPAGGPQGLSEFEAKVRGDDGDRREAAE